MYDQNNQGPAPMRQLFDVTSLNLTCTECGAAIEKLPFQPTEKEDGTYGRIYCRDCNRKRREKFGGPRSFGGPRRDYNQEAA